MPHQNKCLGVFPYTAQLKQNTCGETDSGSADQEFPGTLWNQRLHYYVHKVCYWILHEQRSSLVTRETKSKSKSKSKSKKSKCPHACHAGAKGERSYSSYSFLTSALDGGEWSALCPSLTLPQGKIRWTLLVKSGICLSSILWETMASY
jgi:hypothetical protein